MERRAPNRAFDHAVLPLRYALVRVSDFGESAFRFAPLPKSSRISLRTAAAEARRARSRGESLAVPSIARQSMAWRSNASHADRDKPSQAFVPVLGVAGRMAMSSSFLNGGEGVEFLVISWYT
ncbi:hypothetical protein [Mesorhizobium sp. 131-3-5]|uniref:hypothetical protein n=1 Tax=Mesorhizobium sp. 131-3-5 TaxID=2744520 RepID=UPI0019263FD4|nr:hypothetical protein [Mesorhizobium sp. 131-3-5]